MLGYVLKQEYMKTGVLTAFTNFASLRRKKMNDSIEHMFQGIIGTIEWCGKKEASNEQQQEKA